MLLVAAIAALVAAPAALAAPTGTAVPFTATQGVQFTATTAHFSEIDDHNRDGLPAATVDWGDGTQSAGTVTVAGAQMYDVIGTHMYASFGTFQVTTTLLWHGADMPQQTVAAGPSTVVSGIAPIPTTIDANIGQPFSGAVGEFRDDRPGATSDSTQYKATIDWGDGTAQTPGTVNLVAGTTFRVLSAHAWPSAGSFTVRVMVTGPNAGATTVFSTATVAGNPSAGFTVSPRPCANIPTTFSDSTTASPGAPIVDHKWLLDDPSAFGSPNGGKPYDTGASPVFQHTFGYSSVSLAVGSDGQPPPDLPVQLFRNPVNVTMTVSAPPLQTLWPSTIANPTAPATQRRRTRKNKASAAKPALNCCAPAAPRSRKNA